MPKIGLDTKFLISIGMDGPSVNRLFHTELQSDLATNNDGKTLIDVGTCSLHTANNSFRKVLDTLKIDGPDLNQFAIDLAFPKI